MIRLAPLISLLMLGLAVSPSIHPQSLSIEGAAAGHAINKAAADAFTKQNRTTRILHGISGNAAGFTKFCAAMLDVLNASRPIQKEELEACAKSKTEFVEVPIAFDAVTVIVNPRNRFLESLSQEELRRLWEAPAQGKIRKWNQVNPRWPDAPVKLLGPDRSGDEGRYFAAALLGEGGAMRQDYMATADDKFIVQGVAMDANAMGYVSLAHYLANRDKVRAVPIQGAGGSAVSPSIDSVGQGRYALGRPLFLYVNARALESAAVRPFVEFYVANAARLAREANYVPLSDATYQAAMTRMKHRTPGSVWGGTVPAGLTLEALQRKQAG